MSCNAVIFDCDGVLFDSNALKTEAFRETLANYPQAIVDEFIAYHQKYGGISRYVKLRAFFTDFLQTSVNQSKLEELLQNFGDACQGLYQEAMLTPGCLTVLEKLSSRIPLYVASGSDETELRKVFAQRGLDNFFQEIYGSPKTKQACVAEILEKFTSHEGIVMVGDAESDWQAAKKTGISFIFMAKFSEAASFMSEKANTENFIMIDTLQDLLNFLS
ncbi:MAG: HAD family hydrolase [Moorea sp. SIO3C2]|nr:HAD family hydrolase [Moorena sp. SIO3C2]